MNIIWNQSINQSINQSRDHDWHRTLEVHNIKQNSRPSCNFIAVYDDGSEGEKVAMVNA
jgi:hypothetical protein